MTQRFGRIVVAGLVVIGVSAASARGQDAPTGLAGGDAADVVKALGELSEQLVATQALVDQLDKLRSEGADSDALNSVALGRSVGLIRKTIRETEHILLKHNPTVAGQIDWAELKRLIKDLHYSRDGQERSELVAEWHQKLPSVIAAVFELLPPLVAYDAPNDKGKAIKLCWKAQPSFASVRIERFDLTRAAGDDKILKSDDAEWVEVHVGAGIGPGSEILDKKGVKPNHDYEYRLRGGAEGEWAALIHTAPVVTAKAQWFDYAKRYYMTLVLIFVAAVAFYIQLAKSGANLNLRKIAGLEAVDEAVGRATEMGRPILFIPGIQDMNDIQTVAGLIILGHVAKIAAEHDAQLEVPTSKSLVMTVARETVAAAYMDAGRPDAYDEKSIYYVTDEQFGYVAAVTGTMVRKKPATCIYMGAFYAESLILAETANTTGAIQIAGTAMPAQLPFFVAACDYTLIGEEFFAASAYLSGAPDQLGSLKGQDVGKVIVLVLLTIGTVLASVVSIGYMRYTAVDDWLIFLKDTFLNVSS